MTMEYDRLIDFYDLYIDETIYEQYMTLIQRYSSKGSLLDIGCGTGTLSLKLAKAGYLVSATDISEEMLQMVQFRAHAENLDLDIHLYDLHDSIGRHYDTIIASLDVFNHLDSLEDTQFAIQSINDALNLHGLLVFDVLSVDYVDMLDGYIEDDEEFHFHWECHRGALPHSVIHHVTLKSEAGEHVVQIEETTYELPRYLEILDSIGLTVLETVTLDERTIIVAQKTKQK